MAVVEAIPYIPKDVSKQNLLEIKIDSITNLLPDDNASDYKYTISKDIHSDATGVVAITNQTFVVPFLRRDIGKKVYMLAVVDSEGNFSIRINFDEAGEWVVNTELLNSELPQDIFYIEEQVFKVV